MQNVNRMLVALSIITAVLVISVPSHAADDNVVKWEAIIGLAAPGSKVGHFDPFGPVFPIVVQDGKAWVHLQTGRVKFSVKGLALANSTGLAAAGTTGVISEVRGTLVCNGVVPAGPPPDFADTPAVHLDQQGNAQFVGSINVPTACLLTPDKLAFLIRVASVNNPAASGQVGRWLAIGAVRTP